MAFLLLVVHNLFFQSPSFLQVAFPKLSTLFVVELQSGLLICLVDGGFQLLSLDAFSLAQDFFLVLAQVLPTMKILKDPLLLLCGKLLERFAQKLKPARAG